MPKTPPQDALDVVIVGGGFAGLAMLRRAREVGLRAIVYEAGDGIGGTWHWNRYPGAKCDFESFDYSYFDDELQSEWEWSERYPSQREIVRYLEHVADREDLHRDIWLRHRVVAATYDEDSAQWDLSIDGLSGASTARARHVILATGSLSAPIVPDVPGIDRFAGRTLMTAAWPDEPVDLTGMRVALIGTGSSGVQVMPELAKQAAQLHVLQRTPAFVVQARNRTLTKADRSAFDADRAAYRDRARQGFLGVHFPLAGLSAKSADPDERQAAFEEAWAAGGAGILATYADILSDGESNDLLADFLRSRIDEVVEDDETAAALKPTTYPVGGKRIVVGNDYHATFNRPNVHLVDLSKRPLERFTEGGVVAGGEEIGLDVLVLATGFDSVTGAFLAIDVTGRDGLTLRDAWAESPDAFLGAQVAGFPNLHLITGPGSPGVLANVVRAIEQHVDWIGGVIATMAQRGATTVEPHAAAQAAWAETVRDLADATLLPGVNSAYVGANVPGKPRVFLMYAGGYPAFQEELDRRRSEDYAGLVMSGSAGG